MNKTHIRLLVILLLFAGICQVHAQCFNMTTLSSANVTCQYGSFSNPYYYTGVASGRHTIMTNRTATDPYGGFLVVPSGENSSVRLGNSDTGAEAEAITYTYLVNKDNPILLLKYAAVMEDPGHSSTEQPRLHLEVMDQNGTLIDPTCSSFDFIASPDLGWQTGVGELYTNLGQILVSIYHPMSDKQ